MSKATDQGRSSYETMLAARRFSRRTLLKAGAAASAVTFAGPALVKNALSSSGELNLLMWSDEFPDPVIGQGLSRPPPSLVVSLHSDLDRRIPTDLLDHQSDRRPPRRPDSEPRQAHS